VGRSVDARERQPLVYRAGELGPATADGTLRRHVFTGPLSFWALGIGSEAVALVLLLAWFKRRGWF